MWGSVTNYVIRTKQIHVALRMPDMMPRCWHRCDIALCHTLANSVAQV